MKKYLDVIIAAGAVALAYGIMIVMLIVSLCRAHGQLPPQVANTFVTLAFDYPTQAMQIAQNQMATSLTNPATWPALTGFVYRVYGSTTLSSTNTPWTLISTLTNPPPVTNNGWVSIVAQVPLVPRTQNFFTITTSNLLGSSFFSGLAVSPTPLPIQGNLVIQSSN